PNYEVFAELIERLGLERPGDDFTPLGLLRSVVGKDEELLGTLTREGIAFPACGQHPVQFVDVFPRTSDQRIQLVPEALEREGQQPLYTYLPDEPPGRFPLALISPSI